MMDGALSGKTGFTGDAGYCYVGALKQGERTFIVALLGCGWPNNKGYKWKDTKALMEYGLQKYEYENVFQKQDSSCIIVENGIPESDDIFDVAMAETKIKTDTQELPFLLKEGETVDIKTDIKTDIKKTLKAPVQAGETVGSVTYYLKDFKIKEYPLVITKSVSQKTFIWYLQKLFAMYMLK